MSMQEFVIRSEAVLYNIIFRCNMELILQESRDYLEKIQYSWFDNYDWAIRLNPDVIIRNEAIWYLYDIMFDGDHVRTRFDKINCME